MSQPKPVQIFISYAHEDAHWREEFERMLAPASERGLVGVWSDESIVAGEEWSRNIQKALASARIGLLLVTDHFLQSKFITQVELANLLRSARNGGVSIRWVPVSASLYQYTDLCGIQACCDPEKPLDELPDAERKAAIKKICVEIVDEFGTATKVSLSRRENLLAQVRTRLGDKYVITGEIASGKSSIVYRAERRQCKQTVVVKVLVASELDDWARQSFIDGVARSVKLTSPAFIKIFDHFMEDSPQFLVQEFIEGEQLSSFLRNYPRGLPLAQVKSILLDLAEALEEAHRQGFRRGEMCPSDILIQQASGLARLSPFDFSNLLREDAQMRGNFLVDRESLAYMTPERFFGHESNEFTDQYSLGIIAAELLGGSRIPGVINPCDLERKRSLFGEFESGQGDWAERSLQFKGIVCRLLRTNPEERWPSMSVVRSLLREVEDAESPDEVHRKMAMTSYLRFQARGVEGERKFFDRFYENLFSALPVIEHHFESIDMERQHHILNRTIHTLLAFRLDSQTAKHDLRDLALRHATLELTPRHYKIFLDTLVKTIGEFGEDSPDQLAAWRNTLEPGIDFMWKCQKKHQALGSQPPDRKNTSRNAGKRAKRGAPTLSSTAMKGPPDLVKLHPVARRSSEAVSTR
jgi:serine/threonine protein kinase